ncbi:MAG: hypothetical protein SF053_10035 [Bacteroidia bacterium]|nr:hypothetical protein [Bacteroidia bacterium]
MKKNTVRHIAWEVGVLLAATGITAGLFGAAFWSPDAHLLAAGGDGLTPYYVWAYYLQHDTGAWFSGFQYPYGNHLIYVASPAYGWLLQALNHWIPVAAHIRAAVNLPVIWGFVLAAWLIYRILRIHLLPAWYAGCLSLIIAFLSPQLLRAGGHYTLCTPYFVPLLWLILHQTRQAGAYVPWMVVYVGVVTIGTFYQPYHFLIGAAWLTAWVLVSLWQDTSRQYGRALVTILAGLVPGISLKLWEYATTPGTYPDDFVYFPSGFTGYTTALEGIFVAMEGPVRQAWEALIPTVRAVNIERRMYLGLPGLVLTAGLLVRLIRRRTFSRILKPVLPGSLPVALPASLLVLLFAMGVPYSWFPELADLLGPIRQFRAPGRLAWIAYSVGMVALGTYLYQMFRIWPGRWRVVIAGGVLTCWAAEAWWQAQPVHQEVSAHRVTDFPENTTDYLGQLQAAGVQPGDFQAIISLPWYHFGSEKLQTDEWFSNRFSMAVSLQTGLPMCNNRSARTPLTTAIELTRLTGHPYLTRPVIWASGETRPFLLLYFPALSYTPGEQFLIDQAVPVVRTPDIVLARLDIRAFGSWQAAARAGFDARRDTLPLISGMYVAATRPDPVIPLPQGGQPGEDIIRMTGPDWQQTVPLPTDYTGAYEWSCWVHIGQEQAYFPRFFLDFMQDETVIATETFVPVASHDSWRRWLRASREFTPPKHSNRLRLRCKGRGFVWGSSLVRPLDTDIYVLDTSSGKVSLNNYPLYD